MRQRTTNLRNMVSQLHKKPARIPGTKWRGLQSDSNERTAHLVQAAALCSRAVYRDNLPHIIPELPGYTVKERHWIEPIEDGSGKAAALFEIAPANPSAQRTIIIAVRGMGLVDWLVDNDLATCPDLLNFHEPNGASVPKVHRGFAQCAKSLVPALLHHIKAALYECQLQGRAVEIVFTGHSSGGAIASLLFCHFLTRHVLGYDTNDLETTRVEKGHKAYKWHHADARPSKPTLSCIGFGCPPMLDADISLGLIDLFPTSSFLLGTFLSFVNDGDPIPRMDTAYAAALAGIWHRVGGSRCATEDELPEFKPPPLSLNGLGHLVVLFVKDQEFKENHEEVDKYEKLMACHLDSRNLGLQAWANVSAHSVNQYVEWATLIGNGSFNGRVNWARVTDQDKCICM
ncbi:alpha/beta-hydrolase [Colletotrichum falcatum]|nr:alpha/beta-hydrolase [Colletotrichum falcatum]